ncbi:hypothetical protein QEG_2895, partial [Clostridioides difficile CD127]
RRLKELTFTYHIVNIKPLEEYNIVEDAEEFTYHLVNIKPFVLG